MKFRQQARRGLAVTVVLFMMFGTQAFASNHSTSIPVSVAAVSGERALAVTGADGTTPSAVPFGPASLAFGSTATAAPFGVIVGDAAYDRVGYQVSATLSNLYRMGVSGFDCDGDQIPAGAFDISYANLLSPTDVEALVVPLLTFTDDITDDLSGLGLVPLILNLILGTLTSTDVVVEISGIVDSLTTALALMSTSNGSIGSFTGASDHPECDGADGSVTSLTLQTGTTASPDLSALRDDIFEGIVGSVAGTMDVADAITANLLPAGADLPGGEVYDATHAAVTGLLGTLTGHLTNAQLTSLVDSVVNDLVAEVSDLVLELIGQTGVYANVPVMTLDRDQVDVTTGLYSGRMTVTLVDVP